MVKYIYKVVVLMVLFCGALFFFGSRLQNDNRSGKRNISLSYDKESGRGDESAVWLQRGTRCQYRA